VTLARITVYDRPAPQGSKRHVGGGRMIEQSPHVGNWREAVKAAALAEMQRAGWPCFDGPLHCRMTFTLRKPASAPKRRRIWPDRTPDLSKLCRATEDALVAAGAVADDARFVELTLAKRYPMEGQESLAVPGVRITIWQIGDTA
jgi:Holliday junction resolvase RusA-like endonuclease